MVQLRFGLLPYNLVSQALQHQAAVQVLQLPAHPQQLLGPPVQQEPLLQPVLIVAPPVPQVEPEQLVQVPITVIPALPIVINQLEVKHEFT